MTESWYTLKTREKGEPNWRILTDLRTTETGARRAKAELLNKWPNTEVLIEPASKKTEVRM